MNAKKTVSKAKVKVSEYLTQQIELSDVPQKDMAEKLGYPNPNIITMFKKGLTKLPLNKVAPFADILGVDRVHFLRLVMQEYAPHSWDALEEIIGERLISDKEAKILALIGEAGKGLNIGPEGDEEENELRELAYKWLQREEKHLETQQLKQA